MRIIDKRVGRQVIRFVSLKGCCTMVHLATPGSPDYHVGYYPHQINEKLETWLGYYEEVCYQPPDLPMFPHI